jgi:hypothetical protein
MFLSDHLAQCLQDELRAQARRAFGHAWAPAQQPKAVAVAAAIVLVWWLI